MDVRPPVTSDDLLTAADSVVSTLTPALYRDWSVPAGQLEWSCRLTAEHLGNCLIAYAAQVAAQPTSQYVRFESRAEQEATAADVLEFVTAGGRILAVVVRAASPEVRAFHPYGTSDPEGFAGMGCVETLVHGNDIAAGLGLRFDPPRDVCDRVLARMFPTALDDLADLDPDPWEALLWSTGRIDLPGRPRPAAWRWRGAPLGDGGGGGSRSA